MKVAYLIWQSGKNELIRQKHVRIYCVYNNLYIKTYSQEKFVKVFFFLELVNVIYEFAKRHKNNLI